MAKKVKEENKILSIWKNRLSVTEKCFKNFHDEGKRFIKYYKGIYYDLPASSINDDRVSVNMVFATVKTIIPAIYAKNPEIITKPRKTDSIASSKLMQSALNYTLKEIELKRTMKRCLLDALLPGLGVIKIGYSYDTIEQQMTPEEFAKKSPEAQEYIKSLPQNKNKAIPTVNEVIKKDCCWAQRWNPFDFFYDPEATSPSLEDARWIAFRSVKPLNTIKEEYNVTPTSFVYEGTKGVDSVRDKEDFKRGIVWEVWDKEHQERIVFCEGSDKVISWDSWKLDIDGFPCETICFDEVPGEAIPMSDVAVYEPQLKEKNMIRTQQTNHRKRFNRKYGVEEGSLTETELAKLEANVDGSFIIEKKKGSITPIQDAPLPGDVYATENRIDRDFEVLTGMADFQRSSSLGGSSSDKTATEASIIESRLRLRSSERIDVIETALRNIVRKLAQIIKQKYTLEHITEIVGENVEWKSYTKEDIQGEYDIDIVIGSTLPIDRAIQNKQALDMLNLLYGKPEINNYELIDNLLETMDVKDKQRFMMEPTLPVAPEGAPANGLTGMAGETQIPEMVNEQVPTLAGLKSSLGVGGMAS